MKHIKTIRLNDQWSDVILVSSKLEMLTLPPKWCDAEAGCFCKQENYAMTCQTLESNSFSNQSSARSEIFSRYEFRFQLSRLVGNWFIRRKVRALGDQDDHILNDIGVRRDEILWAARLPLTVNAAIALHDRSCRRRQIEGFRAA